MATPTLAGQAAMDLAARRLRARLADADPDEGDGLETSDDLAAEVDDAARLIAAHCPCIGPYEDLDATDKTWYDRAAGLKAVIALLDGANASAHDGLSKLKTPDFEYTFTAPDKGERDRLAGEVSEALGLLSCVRAARLRRSPSGLALFGAAGVARAREARLARFDFGLCLRALLPPRWGD